ncbi:uncharacterized protein LOC118435273 [Folsomia candida]|uniref:Uncharacterized protein n=1 Tax=Folsomia candida TaxID=158441 RepID=A0A226EF93_FOLCA|nr:uncharacterized protein LOC118435273 [Folsomia candida]OXA56245.1 hypothetical protein Fcan01_09127 [Folsomia candida]
MFALLKLPPRCNYFSLFATLVVAFHFAIGYDGDNDETTTTSPDDSSIVDTSSNKTVKKFVVNFPLMNRTDVERNCTKLSLGKCWSSDYLLPICASNMIVYQNPGVFVCAQVCYPDIELEIFCDPHGTDVDELQWCKKCKEKITQSRAIAVAANATAQVVVEDGGDGGGGEEQPPPSEDGQGGGGDVGPPPTDGNNAAPTGDEAPPPPPPPEQDLPPVESNDLGGGGDNPDQPADGMPKKKRRKHKKPNNSTK